ncbi:hypothetical protein F4808DRAFT_420054 [Astrocystis sublimbata]|nr:hypothetical protein F4808DRAFT_420054 [Astrocystis sublimbata]
MEIPNKRKREVLSCIPCYTRKQKCDRHRPCRLCSQRRRPDLCSYYPSQAPQPGSQLALATVPQPQHHLERATDAARFGLPFRIPHTFGCVGTGKSNTMILIHNLGVHDKGSVAPGPYLPHETVEAVQEALKGMPSRTVLDFLVWYFAREVQWYHQILYIPSFISSYNAWWTLGTLTCLPDVEFAVLFLRVCWYASHFLPSPSCSIDSIRGMALSDIRKACAHVTDILEPMCKNLDARGSLARVQHQALAAMGYLCQSEVNQAWDSLSYSVCVAQRLDWHPEVDVDVGHANQVDREIRRRTLCSLYVYISTFSRRIGCMPFFPDGLNEQDMPQMHLLSDVGTVPGAPDAFSERLLQVQLIDYWRLHAPASEVGYDPLVVQETYDDFCSHFICTIPPVFGLKPDQKWDDSVPRVLLQRHVFHVALFESLCHNFRPAVLPTQQEIEKLPTWKQTIWQSHTKALAVSAINLLKTISNLQMMICGSYTRFSDIIMPTFEAATLLLTLCNNATFPAPTVEVPTTVTVTKPHPLSADMDAITREGCMQAIKEAIARMQKLAEVSKMADVGMQALTPLAANISILPGTTPDDSNATEEMNSSFQDLLEGAGTGHQMENPVAMSPPLFDLLNGQKDSSMSINWDYVPDFMNPI